MSESISGYFVYTWMIQPDSPVRDCCPVKKKLKPPLANQSIQVRASPNNHKSQSIISCPT
jgi:hypothetical protein